MSEYFTNVHAKSADRASVCQILSENRYEPFFMSNEKSQWISVFPEALEEEGSDAIEELCKGISAAVGAPVFCFAVYDGECFNMTLAIDGQIADAYESDPGLYDGSSNKPKGGNVDVIYPLCKEGTKKPVLERLLKQKKFKGQEPKAPVLEEMNKEFEKEKAEFYEKYCYMAQLPPERLHEKMPDVDEMLWHIEQSVRYRFGVSEDLHAQDQAALMASLLEIPEWCSLTGFSWLDTDDPSDDDRVTLHKANLATK